MPRQNREMPLSQKVRFAAGAFLLAASGCGAAGIIIIDWFHVNRGGGVHWYGLFYQADSAVLDAPDAYGHIGFDDLSTICARNGADMEHRNYVTQATAVAGLIIAFVASMLSVIDSSRILFMQLVGSLIAAFMQVFTVAWSAYIFEAWYWCGKTACEYDLAVEMKAQVAHVPCFQSRGRGWNVYLGAACCSFLGLLLVLVASFLRRRQPATGNKAADDKKPEPKQQKQPTAPQKQPQETEMAGRAAVTVQPQPQSAAPATHEPTFPPRAPMSKPKLARDSPAPAAPTHAASADGGQSAAPTKNVLPPGDWVFDAQSGLYWSEQEKLFLHLETAMFFDPSTNMWCNSETGEWFHPEENAQ